VYVELEDDEQVPPFRQGLEEQGPMTKFKLK